MAATWALDVAGHLNEARELVPGPARPEAAGGLGNFTDTGSSSGGVVDDPASVPSGR